MKDILYLKKSKGEPVSAFLNQTPTTDINGLNSKTALLRRNVPETYRYETQATMKDILYLKGSHS